eukprot:gb/GECH01014884.1/.p1 GENE.gb/GECH01014884.1/~~gb/GECH01014884.1/.p1  ORF type:complete len:1016 (+),score=267.76 gb/GECH01014884.1/:1-3048(+)
MVHSNKLPVFIYSLFFILFFVICFSFSFAEKPTQKDVQCWAQSLSDAFQEIANGPLNMQAIQDEYQKEWDNGRYREEPRNGEQVIDSLTSQLKHLVNEKISVISQLEQKLTEELDAHSTTSGMPDYIDSSNPNDVARLNLKEDPNFPYPVDISRPVIKFAPGVDRDTQSMRTMLNVTQELYSVYRSNLNLTTWQYFGSSTGFLQRYPGAEWAQDSQGDYEEFDPRFRPWYVGSSSGSKDIILVIDTSGSMTGERLRIAKEAVNTVLQTLTVRDYVNVVMFSSGGYVSPCFSLGMVRAMPENIAQLQSFVNSVSANGGTDFNAAFSKAFDILDYSYENGLGTGNAATILFMTDGQSSDPTDLINRRQYPDNPVAIFSYALGSGADATIPQKIAEDNNGIFFDIEVASNLRTKMGEYYTYFALNTQLERTFWTTPFYDASGLGLIISVALPVFDRRNSEPELIGVMGTDVPVAELFSQAFSTQSQSSYSFIVNDQGQVLTHPRLKAPSVYTAPPAYVDIDSLETDPKFARRVRGPLVSMESGSTSMTIRRALPRGDVAYEGVRFQELEVTYFWRPIEQARFAVGYVLASSDETEIYWEGPSDLGDVSTYYHRIDLYPGVDSDSISVQKQGGDLYTTRDVSTYKIAPKGFRDPYAYQSNEETASTVQAYNEFMDTDFNEPQSSSTFVDSIRPAVRLSLAAVEDEWKSRYDPNEMLFVYYGTETGMFRAYPGYTASKSFDATRRPWYLRAIANQDKMAVSTPYEDASFESIGTRYIVTISHTIREPRDNGKVVGVAGIDFTYESFASIIEEKAFGCSDSDVSCMLVDSSGLFVYHPLFADGGLKTNIFMGDKAYRLVDLARYLNERGCVGKQVYNDYAERLRNEYFTMCPEINYVNTEISACQSAEYQMIRIPDSNLFLVVVYEQGEYSEPCQSLLPSTTPIDICRDDSGSESESDNSIDSSSAVFQSDCACSLSTIPDPPSDCLKASASSLSSFSLFLGHYQLLSFILGFVILLMTLF